MATIPPDAAERARTLFGDFIEGRWEEKREEFSENLRGHADADRIARGWAHTASSAGGFERACQPSARQFGEYTVVELPLALDPRPVRVFVHGIPGVTDLITLGRPRLARRRPRSRSSPGKPSGIT